jgi:hypothetical protein
MGAETFRLSWHTRCMEGNPQLALNAKEAHMGKQLDLPKTLRKQKLRKNAAKVLSVRYLAQSFVQLQRLRQQVHAAEKGQAAGRPAQVSAGPV